ncbi:MAG TPA: hypothetical protein VGD55_04315, partial [Acidothermaceae bacterium]
PMALIGGFITPAQTLPDETPPDQREAISQLETLMRARVEHLTELAIATGPAWMRPLGPAPRNPRDHTSWIHAVATIAAYRDRYTIRDDDHTVGEADFRDPGCDHAYHVAVAAGRIVRSAIDHERRRHQRLYAAPTPTRGAYRDL